MNYIKNIYANEQNQMVVKQQIEAHIREKFNLNIDNIPDIHEKIREFMYKAYCNFKKKYTSDAEIKKLNPYNSVLKMNKESVELFIRYYINEYRTKQNVFSNSEIGNNFCSFTEDSFNSASTFLTEQQNAQQQHIDKIMMRSFNKDAYFSDRNTSISNIYSDQGFNPRKLHKKMVKQYEHNKNKANTYRFNQ